MSNVVSPSSVTLASGQQINFDAPSAAPETVSARQAYRQVINSFPGQSSACPLCGSWAHEAPEGQHGYQAPIDSLNSVGDAVWKAEHCFKCGYRSSSTVVVREAELYAQFRAWMQQQTVADLAHATLNPPSSTDELAQLTALAEKLGVTVSLPNAIGA